MHQCPACHAFIKPHLRHCKTCGADCGFPNVRASLATDEVQQLKARYAQAQASIAARELATELAAFEELLSQSRIVLQCNDVTLLRIAGSDNEFITSFYEQVGSGARTPEDNRWDRSRTSIESRLFQYYHTNIVFAALSLTAHGAQKYGAYSLILRNVAVEKRTSLFEENCFLFVSKRELLPEDPIPLGFRADWGSRHILAVAKLHGGLKKGQTEPEMRALLFSTVKGDNEDFIEAHIYGEVGVGAIESAYARAASSRPERAVQTLIKGHLKRHDLRLEVERV